MPTATNMKFDAAVSTSPADAFAQLSTESNSFFVNSSTMKNKAVFHNEDGRKFLREFFNREPCLYSQKIYKQAGVVFDALKLEVRESDPLMQRVRDNNRSHGADSETRSNDIPHVEFDCDREKQLAYELVFKTLKYQRFLEDILEDCSFFHQYPELKDDHGLVLVMFNDFKQRKFQTRSPIVGEVCDPYLSDIEHALMRSRTRLNAALARRRIKAQVLSIDDLLPQSVRQNDKPIPAVHVYCWVNQLKTNINTVLANLIDEGFEAVHDELDLNGLVYMRDNQCNDAILLPSEQRNWIRDQPMVENGHLVLQDKSSCVGPQCIKEILNEGDDVILVNVGSGLSTAHVVSLTHHMDTNIFAFGIRSEKQHNQVSYTLERLGASGRVKLMTESLEDVDLNDERFKNIKVALMAASCSRSGVVDPVNFLVTEGEDLSILKSLTQGNNVKARLSDLVMKHNKLLTHVLKFPRMQAVIYYTRSINQAENEGVVTRAIEYANAAQQKKNVSNFRISPPVLPLSQMDIEGENTLTGKYLRYKPSSVTSGCFVATIIREAVDPKESAKEVLARATAKGLISGVPPEAIQKAPKAKSSDTGGTPRVKGRKTGNKNQKSSGGLPKRSKSQPSKESGSTRNRPVGGSGLAALPLQTMSVPSAQATTTILQPFAPETVPKQPVQPRTYPSPVPFGQDARSMKPMVMYTPPEHRKVVQHPKPFSDE